MIVGIDIGGTNTQAVIMKGSKIAASVRIAGNAPKDAKFALDSLLKKSKISLQDISKINITGGYARLVRKNMLGKKFGLVGEIKALAKGGVFVSGKKNIFVVSIGTGTAMVSVKGESVLHAGGSGIGGGTLNGLAKLILNMDVAGLEDIAEKGKSGSVDLTVGDIVGRGMGMVPASATAANLGKVKKSSGRNDVAAGITNLVAESLGTIACFAAKNCGQEKNILICGRVILNKHLKRRILYTVSLFGGKAAIPRHSEYCAAIGAAIS